MSRQRRNIASEMKGCQFNGWEYSEAVHGVYLVTFHSTFASAAFRQLRWLTQTLGSRQENSLGAVHAA